MGLLTVMRCVPSIVKFEPFVLYEYSVGPALVHSVWGEFLGRKGDLSGNAQLSSLEATLESLRHEFPTSAILLEGDSAPPLTGAFHVSFESRYVMDQHNGRFVECRPTLLHLFDISKVEKVNFAGLVSADVDDHVGVDIGVATFFSKEALRLDRLKADIEGSKSLESLHLKIVSAITAFLGFDHDAFFTLKSRDADFVEEVMKSARLEHARKSVT